jgi:hypothetical protein
MENPVSKLPNLFRVEPNFGFNAGTLLGARLEHRSQVRQRPEVIQGQA